MPVVFDCLGVLGALLVILAVRWGLHRTGPLVPDDESEEEFSERQW